MKTQKMWRQGDVLVIGGAGLNRAKALPREAGQVVLAHGEVTGHSHAIKHQGAQLFAMEDNRVTGETADQMIARLGGGVIPDRVLTLERPAALRHEEHDTIKLPAGDHLVRVQREYQPGAMRSVAD